jgi:DNA-directed RNA polymerase specialized sigma24 family protein
MSQGRTWPSVEDALDIHARLSADDPVAPSDLANAYLDVLAGWLRRANPRLDPHLCEQAAADAIISLIKNPHSFNPDKSPLDAYLRMSAQGDLHNALEREQRHRKRRESFEVVELHGAGGNLNQENNDPAAIVAREAEQRDALEQAIPRDMAQVFTRQEQLVVALMVQGERRTEAYAQVLDISSLPEADQRNAVKRVKDRIKKRLQRARGGT